MPKVADPLSPVTFVDKINVPTFMACQWTDEQTGGHCPTLAEHMTGTDRKWFTFTNGTHVDSLDPETLQPLVRLPQALRGQGGADPRTPALIQAGAPVVYQEAMGIAGVTLPPDPIQQQPTYAAALAAFEAAQADPDPVRQRRRRLAARPALPGLRAVVRRASRSRARRRARGTSAPDGALRRRRRRAAPAPTRSPGTPHARPLTNFTGDTGAGDGGLWTATPPYHWAQTPTGSAVVLPDRAAERGHDRGRRRRACALWVRSSKPNVDLQATISEVRPDGKETFVQGGWVRAQRAQARPRARARRSSRSSACASPTSSRCRAKRFVKVTIPLYYQGHAYRAGSRIRVTISAPNGDQPIWAFGETEPARARRTVSIASLEAAGRRG